MKCDYKLQTPDGNNTIDIYFYKIFIVKICKDINAISYIYTFTFLNMKWFFILIYSTECAAGSFGNNCTKNCSLTCGDPGVCDKVTGHCNGSCLAGWEGDMCDNGKLSVFM